MSVAHGGSKKKNMEDIITIYGKRWGERNSIAPKDVKEVIKMILDIFQETDYDIDAIEALVVCSYKIKRG